MAARSIIFFWGVCPLPAAGVCPDSRGVSRWAPSASRWVSPLAVAAARGVLRFAPSASRWVSPLAVAAARWALPCRSRGLALVSLRVSLGLALCGGRCSRGLALPCGCSQKKRGCASLFFSCVLVSRLYS